MSSTQFFSAKDLGAREFRDAYKLQYAYASGSMYKGLASKELVVRMGKAGLLGFFGAAGLRTHEVEAGIEGIQAELRNSESFGVNLLSSPGMPFLEDGMVDLLLKYNVKIVEASAFMQVTEAIVRYRLSGLSRGKDGSIQSGHRVIAKISRPEVAAVFLNPAPDRIVNRLLAENKITKEQSEMAKMVPVATELCVEADSGGHTDMGVATVIFPTIKRLRDEICNRHSYKQHVCVGAAGGIGTPEAVAAMFLLGADFITTGSINQCTPESGASDTVKDMLQGINIQDTAYAPAGDMFEIGARVQVLKQGTFFPARANKLYDLWKQFNSLDEIDERTKQQIEKKYFGRTFDDVYAETKQFYSKVASHEIENAEKNPKHKMALIFRWYFIHSNRLARAGDPTQQTNYQVHIGPAMGAFNQWVKGTKLENWRNRHVDEIGIKLMEEAANFIEINFKRMRTA